MSFRQSASIALAVATTAAALAACSVAPVYDPPELALPAAFGEAGPAVDPASWKPAEPADALARGKWWRIFGDEQLDALESEAAHANQTLKAGLARLEQARALAGVAAADRWPQVEAGAGPARVRPSTAARGLPASADTRSYTMWRAEAGASYEVDLFGRVSNAVNAADADARQAEALQQALLLAIQADVAGHYLLLRGLDAEIGLLDDTVKLREAAVDLVERRTRAGETDDLDFERARTELSVARADGIALSRLRAETEHALAVLVGRAPSQLRIAPRPIWFHPIAIPVGLPSTLLERRPDIAAAERAMAAANARIGVARSAYFPRLTLTGLLGLESNDFGDLARSSSRTWALGPLVGTMLSMTVFDGGRRRAVEAGASAAYDETVASYRQTVLVALREVEDKLSGLRILAEQSREQTLALEAAGRAAELSGVRYRAGLVSYFEVIDAERQLLATRRASLQTDRERALATVALVRAIGGHWEPEA
ncbi:MAG TPA: efflux transporter outer membrane subunit [Burkholderiaceae bacterium]|nr:efflux transporter outer membrane subunit [Burkholderiaceae bacterium]